MRSGQRLRRNNGVDLVVLEANAAGLSFMMYRRKNTMSIGPRFCTSPRMPFESLGRCWLALRLRASMELELSMMLV